MARIPLDKPLIQSALLNGLKVGLFFRCEEIELEYHFVRDLRSNPGACNLVTCVMYTCTLDDPLRLFGTSQPLGDFLRLVDRETSTINYALFFKRYDIRLFPSDWYPCFESDPEGCIKEVEASILTLTKYPTEPEQKVVHSSVHRSSSSTDALQQVYSEIYRKYDMQKGVLGDLDKSDARRRLDRMENDKLHQMFVLKDKTL